MQYLCISGQFKKKAISFHTHYGSYYQKDKRLSIFKYVEKREAFAFPVKCKLLQPLWKRVQSFLKTSELYHDSTILLTSLYPK